MIDFYSKSSPERLVMRIINISESTSKRLELVPETFPVQLSLRTLENDFIVKAHKHLTKNRFSGSPVEAWLVFSGIIRANIYENDGTKIDKVDLRTFDLAIFYSGGHALQVVEGPATMLEIKTGPYEGVENDKVLFK